MQYEFKNIDLEDPPLHSCWWSLTIDMGIESLQFTQSTFGVSPTCKKTFHFIFIWYTFYGHLLEKKQSKKQTNKSITGPLVKGAKRTPFPVVLLRVTSKY